MNEHVFLFLIGIACLFCIAVSEENDASVESIVSDERKDCILYPGILCGHRRSSYEHDHRNNKDRDFRCPAIYGRYPHPKDCDRYYECRFGQAHIEKCNRGKLYDQHKEKCDDKWKVKCHKKDGSSSGSSEENSKEVDKTQFKCPYIWGSFPHPVDCSKYYVCLYKLPTLNVCKGSELFDVKSKKCRDERKVDCGKRLDRKQMKTSKRPNTESPTTPFSDTEGTTTSTAAPTTTEDPNRFSCPFPSGKFADPLDCSQYYECEHSVATLHKCPSPSTLYDERLESCEFDFLVKCGERPGGVRNDSSEEDKKEDLRCPYNWGSFPHPHDCAKYMICVYNVPNVFSCKKSELFHALHRRCLPKDQVTCDYRINPDDLFSSTIPTPEPTTPEPTTPEPTTPEPTTPEPTTPEPTTPEPTTPEPTTPEPTTPEPTTPEPTTPEPTTPEPTTPEPTTPEPTTPEPTTPEPTTPEPVTKPNTPPPTNCEDDDVDCIIDETGDVKGWFDCPERYGHFKHGSSSQLFIHCDNWKPFVKKCADGTAFSQKYLVCMWIDGQI